MMHPDRGPARALVALERARRALREAEAQLARAGSLGEASEACDLAKRAGALRGRVEVEHGGGRRV